MVGAAYAYGAFLRYRKANFQILPYRIWDSAVQNPKLRDTAYFHCSALQKNEILPPLTHFAAFPPRPVSLFRLLF